MTQSIIIDNKLKELLKPLEPEELQQLEQSIIDEGCRDSLVLWGDILIDGHNRYEICTRNGINFETSQKHFDSYDDAKVWMLENQLARRNLNHGWQIEYRKNIRDILKEKNAKKRDEDNKKFFGNQHTGVLSNLDNTPKNDSRKELAEMVGVGTATIARADVIMEQAPDVWQEVLSGKKTIGGAYNEIKKTPPHVSNNSGDNEWYTPIEYIKAAKVVMGNIDLDPASTEAANNIIGASNYYTAQDDGLQFDWAGKVWMNPPYAKELIGDFVDKLVNSNDVTEAIILVNNATETKWFNKLSSWSSGLCLPVGRVKFWHPSKVSYPLQGQAILYIGENIESFLNEFKQFGEVWQK